MYSYNKIYLLLGVTSALSLWLSEYLCLLVVYVVEVIFINNLIKNPQSAGVKISIYRLPMMLTFIATSNTRQEIGYDLLIKITSSVAWLVIPIVLYYLLHRVEKRARAIIILIAFEVLAYYYLVPVVSSLVIISALPFAIDLYIKLLIHYAILFIALYQIQSATKAIRKYLSIIVIIVLYPTLLYYPIPTSAPSSQITLLDSDIKTGTIDSVLSIQSINKELNGDGLHVTPESYYTLPVEHAIRLGYITSEIKEAIVGSTYTLDGKSYSSAAYLIIDGQIADKYYKTDYFPYESFTGSKKAHAPDTHNFETSAGSTGVILCWEVMREITNPRKNVPDIWIILSNTEDFTQIGHRGMLYLSQILASQTKRKVLLVSNAGETSYIDEYGHIRQRVLRQSKYTRMRIDNGN